MRRAARRGLDAAEAIVEYTIDPITAFEQAERIVETLTLPDRPTAIVCVNDQIAFAVLRSLARHRLRVPRDVSVVGYDDVSSRRCSHRAHLDPPSQSTNSVARRANC